jgi:hypothetical protein
LEWGCTFHISGSEPAANSSIQSSAATGLTMTLGPVSVGWKSGWDMFWS